MRRAYRRHVDPPRSALRRAIPAQVAGADAGGTLALSFGIGLTATMWSIIYGALIKGLPYDNAQQIVALARTMFMIFGLIALFLAGIGLYAVMAFSVSRRTREVGIRMALGASRTNVVSMIFRQGMLQLGAGLALGLLTAAGVSRLLSLILFDVQPRDPQIFSGVVAVLGAAGLLACLIPARRAVGVDPMIALRTD